VRRVLDELWPVLDPQQLLVDLYASPARLATAMPGEEGRSLLRAPGSGWTAADVPLLDEAAELLEDTSDAALAARLRRREELEYARGRWRSHTARVRWMPSIATSRRSSTSTTCSMPAALAERHEHREQLTTAERAAADRRWAFGHIIVDEAQELSPMAWRLLMRRCPSRSMTIVGDVAQTGDLAGASSWSGALSPYVADRWRLASLTVNYRTPAEIMAVAASVLAEINPSLEPPRSVRESGVAPWSVSVDGDQLAKTLVEAVVRETEEIGAGRLGVIAAGPAGRPRRAVAAAVRRWASAPAAGAHHDEADLERRGGADRKAVQGPSDSVVVVDLDTSSPVAAGRSDLRRPDPATQRLGILRPLPPPIMTRVMIGSISDSFA
jgi:hypothetical protein